jgi:hypothetical protein
MVDRYTKAVLTVIAVALLMLVAQNAIRTASAQGDQVQKVQVCDTRNCADLEPLVERFGTTGWALNVVARNP